MAEAFTLELLAVSAYQNSLTKIWEELLAASPEQILDPVSAQSFAARLYNNWMLLPLEWDESRQRELKPDAVITSSRHPAALLGPPILQLVLPLISKKSNPRVLTLRPESGWVQRGPNLGQVAAYVEKESIVVLRGTADNLANFTGTAETLVQLINADVERYYQELSQRIDEMIRSRQSSILKDQEDLLLAAERLGARIPTPASRNAESPPTASSVRRPKAKLNVGSTGHDNVGRAASTRDDDAFQANFDERPVKAFIAYAREDEKFLKQLVTHLTVLQRTGVIQEWYDRKILAGSDWESEIDKNLEDSELILLLVSPDFIVSNYCFEREMQRALERHDQGISKVVPIILRPVHDWKTTPLGRLQAVPRDGKPVSNWSRRDDAWVDVVAALRQLIVEHRRVQ